MISRFPMLICFTLLVSLTSAFAEGKTSPAKQPASSAEPKRQVTFDAAQLYILIKSTIMALQHANQTGNYSVLRDLGTPVFREQFDQTRLAAIFSNLRSRGIVLSPVLLLTPNLVKQPELTQNQLHVVGNFPTQPLQIQYELVFVLIDGTWRIEGMAVDAVPVQAVADASASALAPQEPSSLKPALSTAKSGKMPTHSAN